MTTEIFKFNKGEKIANVPFEILKESVQLKQAGTNHPGLTRPLQSWELIETIEGYLNDAKIVYSLDPIYVQSRSSHRILTKEEEKEFTPENTPAHKWMFDHVITRFNMGIKDGMNPSIGLSFNKKGVHVVWGTNVMVCQNMCVFGDNIISTYGASRLPFSKQMDLLQYWIEKMDSKFAEDQTIIDNMRNRNLDQERLKLTMGDLYMKAIAKAYNPKKAIDAPLNTGVLSQMAQQITANEMSDMETVWNLYNLGTQIIKPDHFNIEDVFPVNIAWSNYLISEFELN